MFEKALVLQYPSKKVFKKHWFYRCRPPKLLKNHWFYRPSTRRATGQPGNQPRIRGLDFTYSLVLSLTRLSQKVLKKQWFYRCRPKKCLKSIGFIDVVQKSVKKALVL